MSKKKTHPTQQSKAPFSEFSKIIAYYDRSQHHVFDQAFDEFFNQTDPDFTKVDPDTFAMFAAEWFVFDYRLPNGKTPLQEYIEKNPDKLGAVNLGSLKQAEESNLTADFWVTALDRGEHLLSLEAITRDLAIQVYDVSASQTLPAEHGMIVARVIRIDGQWYLAGNPLSFLPIEPTQRMKQTLREGKSDFGSETDAGQNSFIDFVRMIFSYKDPEEDGSAITPRSLEPLDEIEAKALIEDLHKEYNALRR
ncbi:MAG: hypothetical protein FWD72_03105, partial [Eggerthellaceae bacterium]|nr:hypothetical protein [Eggerthellaceae bacterium]